jgi:hydroxymethylbilane synthase
MIGQESPLRIGTRGSPLALWQARHVAGLVRPLAGARGVTLVEIQTTGDQVRDQPLGQIGGQGVFTKEIQRALLDRQVDIAVHSMKDLPTDAVDGITLAAVPERGHTGDAFVSVKRRSFDSLPRGATLATSSLRRRSQALHRRPDLRLADMRGNVETRLRKLVEQDLDGLILAQAGLERLGLNDRITEILDPQWMLPAVGQGALAIECRSDDSATLALLQSLNHEPTRQAVLAERAMLRELGGGCLVPIGAAACIRQGKLKIRGVVLSDDGRQRVEASAEGAPEDAEALGIWLAMELRRGGALRVSGSLDAG